MRAGFADELGDQSLPDPNQEKFNELQKQLSKTNEIMAYFAPRGIGPTAWSSDERKQTQIRRRFMLLGQTLDGMRVWDVRRAIQTLRRIESTKSVPIVLQGKGQMAGITLYACLFEPDIAGLELWHLPHSHRDGPILLNVLRYLDTPQAVAMAAERSEVRIHQQDDAGWLFPQAVARTLGWPEKQFQVCPIATTKKQ